VLMARLMVAGWVPASQAMTCRGRDRRRWARATAIWAGGSRRCAGRDSASEMYIGRPEHRVGRIVVAKLADGPVQGFGRPVGIVLAVMPHGRVEIPGDQASDIDDAARIWAEATAARDGQDEVPGLGISRPVIQGVLDRSWPAGSPWRS
jgi:hypothetical protein